MVHCAVIDCTNSSIKKNNDSISVFKLPNDPEPRTEEIMDLKTKT